MLKNKNKQTGKYVISRVYKKKNERKKLRIWTWSNVAIKMTLLLKTIPNATQSSYHE